MNMKILSFNVHKGVSWLGKRPTLTRIREEILLLQPDLIFLQEICDTQFEWLAADHFPYVSYGKNAIHKKGHHGNAILSKFPIHFSQNMDISMSRYEKRGLLHTIIQIDHQVDPIHLICVHLGLLKHYRRKQLSKIIAYVEENIPTDQPLIIGGDFNDWRSHATEPMIKQLGLQEPFLMQHGAYARTFPAWIPLLKLDRIYSRGFEVAHAERLIDHRWKRLSDHIAINVSLKRLPVIE
jgi:endonuclease/exonuclease/phosphatase family metal-dependent hydrolase